MSQAIEIVKPGQRTPTPTPSKLNPVSAQPFIPTQQQQQQQPQPAPPPVPIQLSQHLQPVEYDYLDPNLHPVGYYAPIGGPLDHHLYQHYPNPNSNHQTPTFFLPPNVHHHLTAQIDAIEATGPPTGPGPTPESVASYSGLVNLDSSKPNSSDSNANNIGGYRSIAYKGWSVTGECVVLNRIVGFRVNSEKQIATVESWSKIKHPGLVHLLEAFTTKQFGDYSLVFVYDFHPLGVSLYDAHLSPLASLPPNPWATNDRSTNSLGSNNLNHQPFRSRSTATQPGPGPILERVLWSYIIQLSSAIKTIHHSGLAVRNLDPSRVLLSSKNRVRISGCGIMDVLQYENGPGPGPGHHQQDDLLALGKVIVALGCASSSAVHNLPASVDLIARLYSPEIKNVVLYLLSKPNPRKSIDEVIALAGPRVLDELNSSLVAEDKLHQHLLKQVENGRLVRLLAKFGFINERPE